MNSIFRSLIISALLPAAVFSVTAVSDEQPISLPPFVVTSQQTTAPLVVTADTRVPAQPIPAQDGADILKSVPGFSIIRKGGVDGDPVFRGMGGSRLGVHTDGALTLGGCGNRMDPPTAYVFPGAYDRMIVLKGPQTVLYGPGNSAAVVIFERGDRRLSEKEATLFASATGGGFGRLDGLIDGRLGSPNGQVRVIGTRSRADDYKDGNGQPVHSAHARWNLSASAVWTPDENTLIELSGARSDGQAAYADRGMDGVAFDRETLGLRFVRQAPFKGVDRIEARLYHSYVDHVMDNFSLRTFTTSMKTPAPAVSNPDRLSKGGRLHAVLAPATNLSITMGMDFQTDEHALRSTSNQTQTPFESLKRFQDARLSQIGLFSEGKYEFTESSRLISGVRMDRWKATDYRMTVGSGMSGGMPNPTMGQQRREDLVSGFVRHERDIGRDGEATIFVGVGRTKRFPDYWELMRNESPGSVSAFRARPELTTQLDVGILHRGRIIEASLEMFATQIDDFLLVQSRFVKPSGMTGTREVTVTRNVNARTYGVEGGIVIRPDEHWRFDATLAYVRGENRTDKRPLAQMPPLEAKISGAFSWGDWSVGGLVRAVSAQERVAVNQGNIVGQDLGRSSGFATVSINGSWKPLKYLRISAGVDNLGDRVYAEHISRAGAALAGYLQSTRVNEPGRFAWLKVDVSR